MAAVSVKGLFRCNKDQAYEDRQNNGRSRNTNKSHRKIPKISTEANIFQRPFLRGLFVERPIFGGAYVRREICVSNSIGLSCSGKEIYHFCFVLLCLEGKFQVQAPRGAYIRRGDLEGFLRYDFGGGWYLEGLVHGGAYFRDFTICLCGIYDIPRWRWVGGNKGKACHGKEQAVEVEILVEWSRSWSKTKNS